MNLMKLFNVKYLMQNIKKSKALIILLVLLVPLFTSIMLLSMQEDYIFSFIELSAINLIGMYIIPIILSIALFGYVYKKNSVDFIGSMPLSRKTIFLTNTFGGIAIIAIIQVLTLICTLFLSKVLSNVIIFGSMVWDIFIFYLVGYIFMFAVSNLAMTFSGNKISQLVSTVLIAFLVPFLLISGRIFYEEENGTDVTTTQDVIKIEEIYHLTLPSYGIDVLLHGEDFSFDGIAITKTLTMSVIYIVIGIVLFQKKKLEMAGESYETRNMHLIIKSLTLFPFMAVFCALSDDDRASIFLFFVAIVAVYYFVFDLVTSKKINLKITALTFLASLAIIFAFYEGIASNVLIKNDIEIEPSDIRSIMIEDIFTNNNTKQKFDLLIDDEKLVSKIIKKCLNPRTDYITYSSYGEVTVETIDIDSIKPISPEDEIGYRPQFRVEMKLKLKNGKEYDYNDYFNQEIWNEILSKYGSQKAEQNFDDMRVVARRVDLNKENEKEIIDILNKTINKMTYKEIYNAYESESTDYTIYLYEYKNHELIKRNYSKKMPIEVFEKMVHILRNRAIDKLYEINNIDIANENEFVIYLQEYMKKNYADKLENDLGNVEVLGEKNKKYPILKELYFIDDVGQYYNLLDDVVDEIKEFIENDYEKPIDLQENYIVLKSYYPNYMWYYTNDIDSICEIIVEKYFEIIERENIIFKE